MLNLFFCLLSALLTALLYLLAPTVSPWWIPALLLGNYVVAVILYFAVLFVISLCLPTKKPIKRPLAGCRFAIWVTMDWLMKMMRVRITLRGLEKLPDEPIVLVSNHRSDFDPMTVLAVLRRRNISYISKQSNFKIPIVGPFIYHAGFLGIDRENGVRALRTLKVAAEQMKTTGVDIGIYPEGTRSRTGKLLRFKSGAFVLAKYADAPIAVMTTKGTESVSKNFPFRKTQVEMEILEIIDRETVETLSVDELSERCRALIETHLYGEAGETPTESEQ